MDRAQDLSKPIKTFHDRAPTAIECAVPEVKVNREMDRAQDLSKPIKTFHDRAPTPIETRSPPR
jgi:hypothetical protein